MSNIGKKKKKVVLKKWKMLMENIEFRKLVPAVKPEKKKNNGW